jgi:hypothetical protein
MERRVEMRLTFLVVSAVCIGLVLPRASEAQRAQPPLWTAASLEIPPVAGAGDNKLGLTTRGAPDSPLSSELLRYQTEMERAGRSTGFHVLVGAGIGAVAGVVFGAVVMGTAVEWIAPPAYYFTVPIGIGVGGLVGLIVGAGRSRSHEN